MSSKTKKLSDTKVNVNYVESSIDLSFNNEVLNMLEQQE